MTSKKTLMVTGASSDIGMELIKECIADYDIIYAHYNGSHDRMSSLISMGGDRIVPVQADLSKVSELEKILMDIDNNGNYPSHFVHLAAPKTKTMQFHKLSWEEYGYNFDIQLRSAVVLLERLIPHMVKNKNGRIVFMLSAFVLGNIAPKYQSPYITAKYALMGLMKNLASEYAGRGITVNGVAPDMIETRFVSEVQPLIISQNAESSPLKRNIEISDVVPCIMNFLKDKSDAVTGQIIGVTGGR